MPYTKPIPIRSWVVLEKLLNYLQNQHHKNHLEYWVKKLRTRLPGLTPKNFVARLKEAFAKLPKNPRGGRPVEVIAHLHISRMPNYTWPKKKKDQTWEDLKWQEEEQEEYARLYGGMVAPDGLVMDCWHINRLFGCGDTNQIVPNIIDLDRPRVRRRSEVHVINNARHVADAITEILNAKRRENGRPLIQTMPERLRELAAKKYGATLAHQLARRPEPVRLKNLEEAIKELGHEVSRFNLEGDTISVIFHHPDEEKSEKKKKARRIPVTTLLSEVYQLRKQRQRAPEPMPQITPDLTPEKVRAKKPAAADHDLRDEEIERLVEEWHREESQQRPSRPSGSPQRSRASEPPQEPPSPRRAR